MTTRLLLLLALAFQHDAPSGGAIDKLVPPVPTPTSFISDAKRVLPDSAHAALDARIKAIQAAGLGDIAVAILPSIGDYSPNQVALEIYRSWKVGSVAAIGSAHRNVGALLLIVPKELAPDHKGQCWINTGLGAEGIITDATAGTICRDSIIPHLKAKDYAGAVGAGIGGIEERLRSDEGLTATPTQAQRSVTGPEQPSTNPVPFALGGLAGVLAFIFGLVRWRRYHRRICPRCGKKMHLLDEAADDAKLDKGQVVEEQLGSVNYDVWQCDCGETLVLPHKAWFSSYSECRNCHRRAASHTRTVLSPATTVSSGRAEDHFTCKACAAAWTQMVTLPMIVASSSSSGSSFGGGGGGGGSSFGGSGSSMGGGGGSSY